MKINKYLVVAAHPDDEVLGCGATIARHTQQGSRVDVVFLADGVGARGQNDQQHQIKSRQTAAKAACDMLTQTTPIFLGLPDNKLDSLPLLEIVQHLETVIATIKPDVVYTHHAADLNIDHRLAHQAVLTACRPQPKHSVKAIYSFEVLSSTEWGFNTVGPIFQAQRFVDVSQHLDMKLAALRVYADEMRDFPHARSEQAVKAQAQLRGSMVGLVAAEAFQIVREIICA